MGVEILYTYLVISLPSTIRLSSFTTNGPTHTVWRILLARAMLCEGRSERQTDFLCELNCHFGNWSYWHIEAAHVNIRTLEIHGHACQSGPCWCKKTTCIMERVLGYV